MSEWAPAATRHVHRQNACHRLDHSDTSCSGHLFVAFAEMHLSGVVGALALHRFTAASTTGQRRALSYSSTGLCKSARGVSTASSGEAVDDARDWHARATTRAHRHRPYTTERSIFESLIGILARIRRLLTVRNAISKELAGSCVHMHRLETIHPCVKKMERVYVPNSDVKTRYRGDRKSVV